MRVNIFWHVWYAELVCYVGHALERCDFLQRQRLLHAQGRLSISLLARFGKNRKLQAGAFQLRDCIWGGGGVELGMRGRYRVTRQERDEVNYESDEDFAE